MNPAIPIWRPPLWFPRNPPASFLSTGKVQRDPATGKINRQPTTGKVTRSDTENNSCCCSATCWDHAFLSTKFNLHFSFSSVQLDTSCFDFGAPFGIPNSASLAQSQLNMIWNVPQIDYTTDIVRYRTTFNPTVPPFPAQIHSYPNRSCSSTAFQSIGHVVECVVGVIKTGSVIRYNPGWWVLVWGGASAGIPASVAYAGCEFWAEGPGCMPANTAIANRIATSGPKGPETRGEWATAGNGLAKWADFGYLGSLTISL